MMERTKIDELLTGGQIDELIETLEEELKLEYDEYSMLKLGQAYLLQDDTKKAKKLMRRLKMIFPAGEFLEDEALLISAIELDDIPRYLENAGLVNAVPQPEMPTEQSKPLGLAALASGGKKRKERVVPENIKEYFSNVVGLENVQFELDKFFKLLRFQNERKQNQFNADLLKSTHFAITGARGCGKTMVGQIIGNMLYDFGVRANGQAVRAEARDLQAAYNSDQSGGITSFLANVTDGTVIIENLQDLFDDDQGTGNTARMVLIELEKVMRTRKDDISIILTGSVQSLKKALTLNDTLQDALHTTIEISPYSTMELLAIAEKLAKERALLIHESAKKVLTRKIDLERSSAEFMNAITLGRFLDQASVKLAERYYQSDSDSEAAMVYLKQEDFEVEMEDESLEEILGQLESLTGLHSVKEQVKKRIEAIRMEQMIEDSGASRKGGQGTLHMLFTGNPGTGKTTVARMLGKIYQQLGILPRGNHMVECTRSGLVGQYQGHTAKLVQEKVKEAAGGILFIDEAYALCRDEHDTFGHEAVDELIAAIENNKDSMMVILAGYKKEMDEFLKSNPGFASRIRNKVNFEDYSVDEMAEIFGHMVKSKGMHLGPDTHDALHNMLEIKSKVPDFGNARGVRNLFDEVLEAMNERILAMQSAGAPLHRNQFDIVTKEDIEAVAGRKSAGEKSVEELIAELNALTGLSGAKRKVQEMVDDIQVKEYMKQQGLESNEKRSTLHLVFKGNAGTGKTTVARLLGQIYKKLGILQKNVFVEVGRKDLVANYSGQTATRVIKKVDEAEGGVLFIDEAYTLNGGERDEFGKEAINTLVAELENRRESLMVIVAGYEREMDQFLEVNQGLASRLANEIIFEDYTQDELLNIFRHQAKQRGLTLSDDCIEPLADLILERSQAKDFGNARGVRNLLEQIEKKKNSRIAALLRQNVVLDKTALTTICVEDLT